MKGAMNEKLRDIFRAVFKLPPDADTADVGQINEPNWDSLAHISLITAVESEFGVTLDALDAMRMTSFRATQLLLEEKGF